MFASVTQPPFLLSRQSRCATLPGAKKMVHNTLMVLRRFGTLLVVQARVYQRAETGVRPGSGEVQALRTES
jgi:hypothetical protein